MEEPASATSAYTDPPRGRRPRPSRPHVIKFRVSQEEYDLLQTKARQSNTDMTAMLRDHIHQARIHPADDVQCLAMLTRIHRNVEALQQWTKTYRQGADAVSIMAHLVAVEREIDRLRAALDHPTPSGLRVAGRPSPKGFGSAGPPTPQGFGPARWQR